MNSIASESVYIEKMLTRTMGNRLLAVNLFKKLFLDLPKQVALIELEIEKQSFIPAQKEVHKLQGTFSFCGFYELEILTKELENYLLTNNFQQVIKSLKLLKQHVEQFETLQAAILKQLES